MIKIVRRYETIEEIEKNNLFTLIFLIVTKILYIPTDKEKIRLRPVERIDIDRGEFIFDIVKIMI